MTLLLQLDKHILTLKNQTGNKILKFCLVTIGNQLMLPIKDAEILSKILLTLLSELHS